METIKNLLNKIGLLLYQHRATTMLLTMIGWLGSIDIYHKLLQDGHSMPLQTIKWASIALLFALLLTLLIGCKNKVIKVIGILVSILYASLAIINAISYQFWGFGISCRMFTIIMESNERESNEFLNHTIGNFASADFITNLAIFLAIAALLIWSVKKLCKEKPYLILVGIIGLIGVVASGLQLQNTTEKKNVNILLRSLIDYRRTHQNLNSTSDNNWGVDENKLLESLNGDYVIDNVVIVIGESASRNHHSIYGYDLNTTPKLQEKSDELVIFNDAISSYSTTSESMKMFFSYKNYSTHKGEWYEYPSVPSIFSHLGFKTYWISNQEKMGHFGGCEDYFSSKCDSSAFVGMLFSGDNLQEKYDEALLPELSKIMKNPGKKLVVLHLMGSHGEYYRRYPKEFARFTEKEIADRGRDYLTRSKKKTIAEYENSILYSDYIVSNIIDTLKQHNQQKTMMIYFSDHGEELYEKRDFAGHSNGYVDIPFIIWTNEATRLQLGEKYKEITQSIDDPISIENLPDFLLGISDIKYQMYDPTLDFTSPSYRLEKRFADDAVYIKGQCD